MLNKQSLYVQVAESLANRIYSGEFGCREKLSSIAMLAEEYGVGQNTVRCALKELTQRQLIQTERGSGVYVRYDRAVLSQEEEYGCWLARRRDVILDVGHLHVLCMPPILASSIHYLNASDIAALQDISERAQAQEPQMRIALGEMACYIRIMLGALKNQTLLRLYEDVTEHIRLPLLLGPEHSRYYQLFRDQALYFMEQSTALISRGELRQAERFFSHSYKVLEQLLTQYIDSAAAAQTEPSLPFRFALCPENHFRYARLANVIVADILGGDFSDSDLLPAAQELCEKYQATLVTVRRALQMLNHYNMVETVNGVGTRVVLGRANKTGGMGLPSIRPEIASLSLECMQIVALVAGTNMDTILQNTDDDSLRLIAEKTLSRISNANQTGGWAIGISMNMMMEHCNCQAVRVIYPQLMFHILLTNRRTWLHSPEYQDIFQGMRQQLTKAMDAMLQRDAACSGHILREVTFASLDMARRYFASLGFSYQLPLPM